VCEGFFVAFLGKRIHTPKQDGERKKKSGYFHNQVCYTSKQGCKIRKRQEMKNQFGQLLVLVGQLQHEADK